MSLYALGDLHLSFQADKSMDKFGRVWKNYERKIENNKIKRDNTKESFGQIAVQNSFFLWGDKV